MSREKFVMVFDGVTAGLAAAYHGVMIGPAQCRAARALVRMTQDALAEAAGVNVLVIKRFEAGASDPRSSTIRAIERVFRRAGVLLIDDAASSPIGGIGVRLAQSSGES